MDAVKTRNYQIYDQWRVLQLILGPAKLWSISRWKLFWTKNLKNFQRALICAFVFVNGLDPILFFEWTNLMGLVQKLICKEFSLPLNRGNTAFLLFQYHHGQVNIYYFNISYAKWEVIYVKNKISAISDIVKYKELVNIP